MAAPSSRKFRSRSDEDDSSGPHAPPAPQRSRRSEDDYVSPKKRRRRSHYSSGYAMPREKPSKIDLQLCVFHSSSGHDWHTAPLSFDRRRIDDRELWEDIRRTYRDELQMAWRRIFLFTRVKHIVPIEYTPNGVPIKKDPKNTADAHSFMHAFHHPDRIRPDQEWVDWFVDFTSESNGKLCGLEFVEGLWAEKLGFVAILITIVIIIVSVVWALRGGSLQTVFTVMSFVLSGAAAEVALVALYFQCGFEKLRFFNYLFPKLLYLILRVLSPSIIDDFLFPIEKVSIYRGVPSPETDAACDAFSAKLHEVILIKFSPLHHAQYDINILA